MSTAASQEILPTVPEGSFDSLETDNGSPPAESRLWTTSYIALILTQLFTAVNDNISRWFVVKIGQVIFAASATTEAAAESGSSKALTLGALCFTLPWLLFAPLSGYLADRFPKQKVVVWAKFAEIFLMVILAAIVPTGNIYLLLALVFLMGTHSALFSPAKFGIIPETMPYKHISQANGYLMMMGIVGSAIGVPLAYALFDWCHADGGKLVTIIPAFVILVGVAVAGWLCSLAVKSLGAADVNRPFNVNPITELRPAMGALFSRPMLLKSGLGIAFFYLIALLFQNNVDAYGEFVLHLKKADIGLLMPLLVVGLGIGSVIAGVWSAGRIQLGMVPVGAFGIAIVSMIISVVGFTADVSTPAGVQSAYYATGFWLLVLGSVTGFFYIPLESYLQHKSPTAVRGSILAAGNALTNLFMMGSTVVFYLLREAGGLSPSAVFLASGLLTLPVAFYAAYLLFIPLLQFLVWGIMHCVYRITWHGRDNIPEEGGVIFVPNHSSWIDGVLLNVFLPRHTRFMVFSNFTKKWYINWLSEMTGTIPLSPKDGPKAIMMGLKEAEETLRRGDAVCIFPEGAITRTSQVLPFQKGVMRLAEKTGCPIIPIGMDGLWGSIFSYRKKLIKRLPDGFRRRIRLIAGKPIDTTVVTDTALLRREVCRTLNKAVELNRNSFPLPIRGFLNQARKNLFKMKVADSSGMELTGGKLLTACLAFRSVLMKHVFAKDEKIVGLLLPPSCGGVIANMAVGLCGKVTANLNYTLSDDVINYCIKEAGIKTVITSKLFMLKRPVNVQGAKVVFLEDLKEKVTSGVRTTAAAMAFGLPSFLLFRILGLNKIKRDDLATVIFTSGSTGEPKGVMLSHHNIATNIYAMDRLYLLKKDDTLIGVLPFFHSFGYSVSMWSVLNYPLRGAYHFNPLDARTVGKLAEQYKGTILLATPTFLKSYLKRCTKEQFAHMRLVVGGAEKMSPELVKEYEEKFGVTPIEGYGCTELSPYTISNIRNVINEKITQIGNKLGTVGQPIYGVEAMIVDPETRVDRGLNKEGLLLIKGPNVMIGYLNRPDKTAEAIVDGWYNTGDFAIIDDDGFVQITGRQSRFSKIGGEMVPHIRIEQELTRILDEMAPQTEAELEVPGGAVRLAVTSAPDETRGERIVVVHKQLPVPIDQLLRKLSDTGLPNLWLPDRESFVEVEQVPLLGTGKLDLKAVKDVALEKFGKK